MGITSLSSHLVAKLISDLAPSCRPEDVNVILNLRTSTSEAFFPLDPNPSDDKPPSPFYVEIRVSIKSSIRPSPPVTLATRLTPLERGLSPKSSSTNEYDESSSPVWINSGLTAFHSKETPGKTVAPFLLGFITCRRSGYSRDLRQSWDFLTIPPMSKGEIVVRHAVPREKIQFFNPESPPSSDRPDKGENFAIQPNPRALGTFWWRWGDLEQDLTKKKFRADHWYDGDEDEEEMDEVWVDSEEMDGSGLTMEIENEAIVEFC